MSDAVASMSDVIMPATAAVAAKVLNTSESTNDKLWTIVVHLLGSLATDVNITYPTWEHEDGFQSETQIVLGFAGDSCDTEEDAMESAALQAMDRFEAFVLESYSAETSGAAEQSPAAASTSLTAKSPPAVPLVKKGAASPAAASPAAAGKAKSSPAVTCDLCGCLCASKQQLALHRGGKKCKKRVTTPDGKLTRTGVPLAAVPSESSEQPAIQATTAKASAAAPLKIVMPKLTAPKIEGAMTQQNILQHQRGKASAFAPPKFAVPKAIAPKTENETVQYPFLQQPSEWDSWQTSEPAQHDEQDSWIANEIEQAFMLQQLWLTGEPAQDSELDLQQPSQPAHKKARTDRRGECGPNGEDPSTGEWAFQSKGTKKKGWKWTSYGRHNKSQTPAFAGSMSEQLAQEMRQQQQWVQCSIKQDFDLNKDYKVLLQDLVAKISKKHAAWAVPDHDTTLDEPNRVSILCDSWSLEDGGLKASVKIPRLSAHFEFVGEPQQSKKTAELSAAYRAYASLLGHFELAPGAIDKEQFDAICSFIRSRGGSATMERLGSAFKVRAHQVKDAGFQCRQNAQGEGEVMLPLGM